eukprot:scaffold360503_cov43-Prasinocladus_malaysianus.AAC.1
MADREQSGVARMDAESKGKTVKEELLKLFDNHPNALPESVKEVIRASPAADFMMNGEYRRKADSFPDTKLGDGPVTLLGDAFHPITGQGANMAFEDAAVLGCYLVKHGVGPEALRAYEADRLPRTKAVVAYNEK